ERRFVPVNMQTVETCLAVEEKAVKEAAIDPMEKLKMQTEAAANRKQGTGRPDPSGGNRKPTSGASQGGSDKLGRNRIAHLLNKKAQSRKARIIAVQNHALRERLALVEGMESAQLQDWAADGASGFLDKTRKLYDDAMPKMLQEALQESGDSHKSAVASF